nr:leukocyte immunoglobulin-like receptor subfamily B member 4 [Peromyscus maniculatus bairdii]
MITSRTQSAQATSFVSVYVWKRGRSSVNLWQLEDAMTPLFTGLLYLGLNLDLRNPVLAGALSKPTLWAVPRNVVAIGNQVTFFCEGPLEAKEYVL